jgi:hypothetical protein
MNHPSRRSCYGLTRELARAATVAPWPAPRSATAGPCSSSPGRNGRSPDPERRGTTTSAKCTGRCKWVTIPGTAPQEGRAPRRHAASSSLHGPAQIDQTSGRRTSPRPPWVVPATSGSSSRPRRTRAFELDAGNWARSSKGSGQQAHPKRARTEGATGQGQYLTIGQEADGERAREPRPAAGRRIRPTTAVQQ